MGFRLTLFTCTTHSVSYIKALIYILLLEKYNKIHWIFLTWYQSHCSKPLVSFTSWVSFTATVVVNTTIASIATIVHQRPLPCRHHHFYFSDQTTGCTIKEDSLICSPVKNRLHRTYHAPSCAIASLGDINSPPHAPPLSFTNFHAPPRAKVASIDVIYVTSVLGDAITTASSSWHHHRHVIKLTSLLPHHHPVSCLHQNQSTAYIGISQLLASSCWSHYHWLRWPHR